MVNQQTNIRSAKSVDSIFKIVNDKEYNEEGKQKANVVIDHYDLKSIYKRVQGEDKNYIENLENKLHPLKHIVFSLPKEKYYFLQDKLFIDNNKNYINDAVDIKIMKLEDDYQVVVMDKTNNSILQAETILLSIPIDLTELERIVSKVNESEDATISKEADESLNDLDQALNANLQVESVLKFYVEKDKNISGDYYSARIILAHESKNLLHEKLGKNIDFDSLDNYVELDQKSFYIWSRNDHGRAWRDELYVRDDSGVHSIDGNIPVDTNPIIVKLLYDKGSNKCSVVYDKLLSPNSTLLILDKLLSNKSNVSTKDVCLNLLKEVAQQGPEDTNHINYNHIFALNPEYENTDLHIAAYNNDLEKATLLVKEGADVNVRNKINHTPLNIAFDSKQIEMLKILFQSSSFRIDESSFEKAICTKSIELVEFLLDKGMDVNLKINGKSIVNIAARNSDSKMVLYLISKGANFTSLDLNYTDEHGNIPLHHAAKEGNIDMVKLLIEGGSKLCVRNKFGETPFTYAKNQEVGKYISDKFSSVLNDEVKDRQVILFKLIKFDNEHSSIVLKLRDESKSAFFPYKNEEVIISIPVNGLVTKKDQGLYAKLPEFFNEPSLVWENMDNVFFVVNLSPYNTISNLETGLYKVSSDFCCLNAQQVLPMGNYVDYNEVFRILYSNLPGIYPFERFNSSVEDLPHEIVRLIGNGVIDLEKDRDIDGDTLLHYAVKRGNIKLLNTLIEQSPNMVYEKNNHGLNPFDVAVSYNKTAMIECLRKVFIHSKNEEDSNVQVEDKISIKQAEKKELNSKEANNSINIQAKNNEMQDQAVSQEKPVQVIDKQAILSNKDQPDEPIVAEIVEHSHEISQSFLSSIFKGIQNLFGSIFSTVSGWFSTSEEINSIPNLAEEKNVNIDESKNLYLLQQDNIRSNEYIKLADTIFKVVNDEEYNHEGKQKVNIMIDHYDLKSLHKRAEGEEKRDIESLETKLHKQKHVLCSLPQEKYYFLKDKFCISDNEHGKCVPISKDIVDIKIVRSENSYKLVILDKTNNTIVKAESIENELFSNTINLINKVSPYNQNEYLIGEINDQKVQTNKISLNQDLDQQSITYSPIADTNLNILQNDELI